MFFRSHQDIQSTHLDNVSYASSICQKRLKLTIDSPVIIESQKKTFCTRKKKQLVS